MKKLGIISSAFFILLTFSINSYAQADQKKDEKSGAKEQMKKASTPSADAEAFNSICAVSGEEVDKNITYTYEGKKYAFCCNKCLSKFKNDPAKYSARISEDGKTLKKSKG
jgi:YHS domain-containing protein